MPSRAAPKLPPHAALIFDLDGTLLDTEPLYSKAVQLILDPYGHVYSNELKKQVMGGDSRRSAQTTIDAYGLPHTAEEFLAAREGHLREIFPDAPEIDGAADFLRQEERKGTRLGLATSSHQHLSDLKLQRRDWRDIFAAIVCGNDPDLVAGKPAPDIFLLCAKRLGAAAADCIVFEDSRNGIAAAKAAGATVVALNSPYVDEDALTDADIIIENYLGLVDG